MLTCWRMSPFEVQFRNEWSDKALTVVQNPLRKRLQDNPEQWHYVALLKGSTVDSKKRRFDFVVDGGRRVVSAPSRCHRKACAGGSPVWFPRLRRRDPQHRDD
mmetsp:Transcript_52033/g.169012  ORF Transcript_52033/g.169012 Transcript_52033/m.169012 type:complete len:103 (+) Transcript_52033:1-309(+)